MENPKIGYFKSAKSELRYIKGTLDLDLKYKLGNKFVLEGLSDSDYGGDTEERKNNSSFMFFLGDNIVTWEL